MSEVNNATPEELIENVEYSVEDHGTVPTPIDPTLTHAGEAADAKAAGDAIRAANFFKKINGKEAVNGEGTIYGTDIKVLDMEGSQTITEALSAAGGKDATEIIFDTDAGNETIAETFNALEEALLQAIPDETIDAVIEDVFEGDEEP